MNVYRLSPRQMEIVAFIILGYKNDEIALGLGIAYGTVKQHIASQTVDNLCIFDKMELPVGDRSRIDIAREALKSGTMSEMTAKRIVSKYVDDPARLSVQSLV
jgi:DNA-binding NarL/FixJ family response regulator